MSDANPTDSPAERWRRVAGRFTERAEGVAPGRWDDPAPCEGWTARDVVRHMVDWMPALASQLGVDLRAGPSVDDDPVAAWTTLSDGVQAVLDDPVASAQEFDHVHLGHRTVGDAFSMVFVGDVLVHTWDLARATGQDESIDVGIATEMLEGMQAMDEALRASGHYGPKVDVPADADVVTRLVAFTGRTP